MSNPGYPHGPTEAASYEGGLLVPLQWTSSYRFYPTLTEMEGGFDEFVEHGRQLQKAVPSARPFNFASVLFDKDPVEDTVNPAEDEANTEEDEAKVLSFQNDGLFTVPLMHIDPTIDDPDALIEYAVNKLRVDCDDVCVTPYKITLELRPWGANAHSVNIFQLPTRDMHEDYIPMLPHSVKVPLLNRRAICVMSGVATSCGKLVPVSIDTIKQTKPYATYQRSSNSRLPLFHALNREVVLNTLEKWPELV